MKIKIKANNKQGYYIFKIGGVVDCCYLNSKTRRGRVQGEGLICPTITSTNLELYRIERKTEMVEVDGCILMNPPTKKQVESDDFEFRIRKLTPKECWRLMDFDDDDFRKAEEVNSNTRLYEQAGNSIVKNCLIAIFGQMFDGKENFYKERLNARSKT